MIQNKIIKNRSMAFLMTKFLHICKIFKQVTSPIIIVTKKNVLNALDPLKWQI